MILSWMAYAVLVGALVTLAAGSLESLLKSSGRPVRFVWGCAIALTIALTLVAPLRRPVAVDQVALPAVFATGSSKVVVHLSLTGIIAMDVRDVTRAVVHVLSVPVDGVASIVAQNSSVDDVVIVMLWMSVTGLALLLVATVYVRFSRRRRAWPVTTLFGASVRVAPDTGPAVMGIAPPEIVIPRWVLSRDHSEQQLVIAHEREHVRARDPLLLLVGCIAVALLPWNVALWYMWSRLRLAIELDCDNRVLRGGAGKPEYGELLLELSSQRALVSPIMPAFAFGTSHLEQRLVAMTSRPLRYRIARRIAACGIVVVAVAAACQSELPTAAQIDRMDVSQVESRLSSTGPVKYTVDGKSVTKAEADAILSERIVSINVINATKDSPQRYVQIRLRNDSGVALVADTVVLRTGNGVVTLVADSARKRATNSDDAVERRRNALSGSTGTRHALAGNNVDVADLKPGSDTAAFHRELNARAKGIVTPKSAHYDTMYDVQRVAGVSPKAADSRAGGDVFYAKSGVGGASYPLTDGSRVRMRRDTSTGPHGTPLVIVDGKISETGLDKIAPNTIKKVEVIKGAAAQALYGSDVRALNGVILITTKP